MKKYNKGTRRVKKIKIGGGWSKKYKKSINCKKPKGFSQRQYCKYGRKKKKKKSTRKKKGGSDSPITDPPTVPIQMRRRRRPLSHEEARRFIIMQDGMTRANNAEMRRIRQGELREGRSPIRNILGDFVEGCTGHRCGLGGGKHKKTRKKMGKPFCKMIQIGKGFPPYCSFVKSGMFNNKMNFKIDGKDTDFIKEINREYMKWLKKSLTMYEDYKSRPKKMHYISAANVLKDVECFDDLSKKDKAYMIEIVATEIALYKLGFDLDNIDFSKILKEKLEGKNNK